LVVLHKAIQINFFEFFVSFLQKMGTKINFFTKKLEKIKKNCEKGIAFFNKIV